MTSYGGPSLGPESQAHGSQQVYLGQMVTGLMVQPWSLGQQENNYLAWDATVVHTCAASYISPKAASAGPASVQAANRKALKYAALPTTHVFQQVAIETLGPLGPR